MTQPIVSCTIPVYAQLIGFYFEFLDDTKAIKLYEPAATDDSATSRSEKS